jgi:hypothetical protein
MHVQSFAEVAAMTEVELPGHAAHVLLPDTW